ncbi:unnamed protein product [Cuscuta epithymum]|uniref:BED-type domain-containing protein n=1 Tax=Cuscuta epithymum TaxID=186058 RepID=A0AAV0DMV5_9ASTE|nr:unnamed protein product [Cuscuta epithymum]
MEQIAQMEDAMNEELIHEVGSNTNPPTEVEVEVDGGSTTIDADLERMDANNDDDNGEKDDDMPTFQRKKKKKTSKAREDFEEVVLPNKTNKYKCVHCKKLLCMPDTGTTSHLWNHLKRCDAKKLATKTQMNLQFQPSKSKFEMNPLSNGKYDHLKQREATAQWILISEQPFNVVESDGFSFMFQVNLPQFEKISRAQVRSDVITVYEIEKRKLLSMLKCVNKISLTTDIWKSKVQKISYKCVTGHFVDSQYQLQKRVLSFMPLPPPHTGVDIFDGLMKCTKDWGIEHKIFTISVDNASNNDVALRIAKVEALKVKDAFPVFAQRETLYHCCPSSGDWEKSFGELSTC